MIELEGTVKQVAYASKIREYVLFQIKNLEVPEDLESKKEQLIKAIEKQKKSKIVIDSFVFDFKLRDVRSRALENITYTDKFTQKELLHFKDSCLTVNDRLKDLEYDVTYELKEEKKKSTKQGELATEKQIRYIDNLLKNVNLDMFNVISDGIVIKAYHKQVDENTLTQSFASELIEQLARCQVSKYSNKPVYFTTKYSTRDCETGEFINKGELVWKDSEGIHRADNY